MNNVTSIDSKPKERVVFWDNIKFLLIILVVVGHFIDLLTYKFDSFKSLYLFIYAFHMPLFIFISGLFYKPKNITSKCLMYVCIGFSLKFISFIIRSLLGLPVGFRLLSDGGLPWFMFALAIFTLLAYFLRNQNKKFILVFSIILACFVGYDNTIGDYLYLSRVIIFFPFFLLGTMINQKDILSIKEKYNKKIFISSSVILFIWGIVCLFFLDYAYNLRHLFTGRNPFSSVVYDYGVLVRLLCYFISFVVSSAILGIIPNKNIHNFSKFGSKTLQIYFWHYPVIYILSDFINFKSMCRTMSGKIVFLELAIFITYVLTSKLFSFPTKNIINYTKKT